MDFAKPPYEAFYGFVERPSSLTTDPSRYYFPEPVAQPRLRGAVGRHHAAREPVARHRSTWESARPSCAGLSWDCANGTPARRWSATRSYRPKTCCGLLLQDLGAVSKDEIRQGRLLGATRRRTGSRCSSEFLVRLRASQDGAVLIIDEAHSLPAATIEQVVQLTALESNREKVLQIRAVRPALARRPPGVAARAGPAAVDPRPAAPLRRVELRCELRRSLCAPSPPARRAGGNRRAHVSARARSRHHLQAGTLVQDGGARCVPRLVNLLVVSALFNS